MLANPISVKLLKPTTRSRAVRKERQAQAFSTPTELSADAEEMNKTFQFHVRGIKKPMLLTDRESPRLMVKRRSVEPKTMTVTVRPSPKFQQTPNPVA